jgi:hypothetical protein
MNIFELAAELNITVEKETENWQDRPKRVSNMHKIMSAKDAKKEGKCNLNAKDANWCAHYRKECFNNCEYLKK